jgi:hypothetical protein
MIIAVDGPTASGDATNAMRLPSLCFDAIRCGPPGRDGGIMDIEPHVGSRRRSVFFVGMAAVLVLALFIGFSRTFFLKPLFDTPTLSPAFIVHGLFGTGWFVMLGAQAWLAKNGRIADHRKLGSYAPFLAAAITLSTFWVVVNNLYLPMTNSGLPRASGMLLQVSTAAWFVGLFIFAWKTRHRPDLHKRAMVLATIAMMAPAFSRISSLLRDGGPPPFDSAYFAAFFIGALAMYDVRSIGKVHRVTAIVGLGYLAWVSVRQPIAKSEAWINLVQSLIGG